MTAKKKQKSCQILVLASRIEWPHLGEYGQQTECGECGRFVGFGVNEAAVGTGQIMMGMV